MKNKNLKAMPEVKAQNKNEGKAVIFIKTRKSEDKIHAMAAEMSKMADDIGLDVVEVIVDEGNCTDIDRYMITTLCQSIDDEDVDMVLVKSILDIAGDPDDTAKFIENLLARGICVGDYEHDIIFAPRPDEREINEQK